MIVAGIFGAVIAVLLVLDELAVRKRNECIKRELERKEWR